MWLFGHPQLCIKFNHPHAKFITRAHEINFIPIKAKLNGGGTQFEFDFMKGKKCTLYFQMSLNFKNLNARGL